MSPSEGPLQGLHVVELAGGITGPYCGKLLADLGADLIKIEPPRLGDRQRYVPPFFEDHPAPDSGLVFSYLNTNKLGITLDVDAPRGRELLSQLVEGCDVLLIDGSPAELRERRLDFEAWHRRCPDLVCTYVTPFGLAGPDAERQANDLVSQHMSAITTGTPRHRFAQPLRRPLAVGGSQAHFSAGLAAAVGTMHALFARRASGEGQLVDVSEVEPITSFQMLNIARWAYVGDPGDSGFPEGARRVWCKDGPVAVLLFMGQEQQWIAFQELLGNPEWMRDAKYRPPIESVEDRDIFWARVSDWAGAHTRDELYRRAQALRVPLFPVNTIPEAVDSEQVRARGFLQPLPLANGARMRAPTAPYRFSGTPLAETRPAPTLGRDNVEVLCGRLGVTEGELVDGYQAGLF